MIQIDLTAEREAELAAVARARGLQVERYAVQLLDEAGLGLDRSPSKAELDRFFDDMAQHAEQSTPLPDEAYRRASFYQD